MRGTVWFLALLGCAVLMPSCSSSEVSEASGSDETGQEVGDTADSGDGWGLDRWPGEDLYLGEDSKEPGGDAVWWTELPDSVEPRDEEGLDLSEELSDTAQLGDLPNDLGVDAESPDALVDLPDTAPPDLPSPLLNEVGCHGDDFIELFNASMEHEADVSGYILADGTGESHQYVIPSGSVLPPQGRLLFSAKSLVLPGFPFGIQCGADTVSLRNAEGALVDSVALGLVMKGNTYSRLPDGSSVWAESSFTPNATNQPALDLNSILFNPMQVAEVSIQLPSSSAAALDTAPDTYVPATFSIVSSAFTQGPVSIGLRLKGAAGTAQPLDQKPGLKLKFNYGDPQTRLVGLKKLTLNSMTQDPSMLHETVAYRIFRALGLPAARTGYAQVTINGEPYGVYLILEPYDEVTLSSHFASTQHLYEGESGVDVLPEQVAAFDVDEGSETDFSDLTLLANIATDTSDSQWLAEISGKVDLVRLLRFWAVEQYVGHWDGYAASASNYYLQSSDEGLFTMLPNGTDQTFVEALDVHEGTGHLFTRCMAIPACLQQYEQTMAEVVSAVESLELGPYVDALAAYLAPWIQADPRKPYTSAEATQWGQGTRLFLYERGAQVTLDLSAGP